MAYIARKMKENEFKNDADFTKRDDNGALMVFCVEAESGAIISNLSWTQACQQRDELHVAEATRAKQASDTRQHYADLAKQRLHDAGMVEQRYA